MLTQAPFGAIIGPMRVQKGTDWDHVGAELRGSMHTAPAAARKDLARMVGYIEGLVQILSNEEVELRRHRKEQSIRQQEVLEKIEQAIISYEQWLMLAILSHG